MTDTLVASEVEVGVDPATAFVAFTDEIDSWWMHGPINFYDAARAVGKRIEPGVGGRILEVYDRDTGEGRELGRITVWEPGARLTWTTPHDDVVLEVTFVATAAGTRVRLEARIPEGGADRGGSSWVRVTPAWFGAWCARRTTTPPGPREIAPVAVGLYYARPVAAARWLVDAFGLAPAGDLPDDESGFAWIDLRVGDVCLIVFGLDGEAAPANGAAPTHEPWVYVADLDAHLARATAAGATIVQPIHQHGYRAYQALDLEGHRWTFAQAPPLMHL